MLNNYFSIFLFVVVSAFIGALPIIISWFLNKGEINVDIKLFGFPIIKTVDMLQETMGGVKIILLGILSTSITFSIDQGNHMNVSIGLLNVELITGISIWRDQHE